MPSKFCANQVHLESKLLTAELVNSSLNASTEPKEPYSAKANLSLAAPPPFGLRQFQ